MENYCFVFGDIDHFARECQFRWQSPAHARPRQGIIDILDQLGGACYFSTLDLASGFWQVPLREENREKTVFSVGARKPLRIHDYALWSDQRFHYIPAHDGKYPKGDQRLSCFHR